MKRRGNRRYYQHHEVLLIRRIRDLLYDQGFTISGARNRLADAVAAAAAVSEAVEVESDLDAGAGPDGWAAEPGEGPAAGAPPAPESPSRLEPDRLRAELLSIRELLTV